MLCEIVKAISFQVQNISTKDDVRGRWFIQYVPKKNAEISRGQS